MSMKFGVCNWIVDFTQEPSCCETLSKMGFSGMQLDIGSYEENFPLSKPQLQAEWKEQAANNGITLCSLMVNETMRNGITTPKESEEYKIGQQAILVALEIAIKMEIPRVIVPSFRASGIYSENDLKKTIEALSIANKRAIELGVELISENVLSVEESIYFRNEILKNSGGQPIKMHIDLFNYAFWKKISMHEILPGLLPLNGIEMHIKNGTSEDPGSLLLSVAGIAQLNESAQCLRDHNYEGWMFLENFYERPIFDRKDYTIHELMQEDLNWMKKNLIK